MKGAYYCKKISDFLTDPDSVIRDALTQSTSKSFYQQLSSQTTSWFNFIKVFKISLEAVRHFKGSGILLEYPIPRRAKRIDAVLILENIIVVVEYKDGESDYERGSVVQLEDYCLDLRDFHLGSYRKIIVPVLFCPKAVSKENNLTRSDGFVQQVLFANSKNLSEVILQVKNYYNSTDKINFEDWNGSKYQPTPTIIEAATALYSGQDVKEISRSHAEQENLTITSNAVIEAIKQAQKNNDKIICFITGVPGAGKTLAGLNIVHNGEFKTSEKDLGVFLSGNSPLIKVLSEALARDSSKRNRIPKKEASRKVSTFIHNVHQFIDEYFDDKTSLPVDNVLIYDEAQRAWTKEYKYFKSKKQINASEPDILLSIMDRFVDSWAVIIALVGGGQEINTGEGGLAEWGKTLATKFSHWKIYISPELKVGDHSTGNMTLFQEQPPNVTVIEKPELHLSVSIRSHKAQDLSKWINLLLSNKPSDALRLYNNAFNDFPLFITRDLVKAKEYLKQQERGSRRCGLIASSGAKRLRALGLDITAGLKGTSTQEELGAWYLNASEDVRSSNFLEILGSEFSIQGLELDWTCVCWDADLRTSSTGWVFRNFEGTKWKHVNQEQTQQFILNKYRVLLSRAREGMIIYIPAGDKSDKTRLPEFYDPIFEYLLSCGIKELV